MASRDLPRSDRLLIGLVSLAVVCLVPLLLRYERAHTEWSPDAAETLANMSESERRDLEANYERFHSQLPPERREEIRRIHELVQSDPEVRQVFEKYHDWLQELTVTARDRIRSAGSVNGKLTQIQQLLGDEDAIYESFAVELDPDDWRLKRFRGEEFAKRLSEAIRRNGVSNLIWITNREFDRMVDVVIAGLPEGAREEFRKQTAVVTDDTPESDRFRIRARALMATFRGMGRGNWISPETADKVLDLLEDSETRQKLKAMDPDQKQLIAFLIVMRGSDQFRNLERYFPTDKQAAELYTSLDREEQIKLMALDAQRARFILNLKFVTQREDVPDDIAELAQSMLGWLGRGRSGRFGRAPEGRRGPPRGERRPGERGPGERGPGERGPGERGPGERGPGERGPGRRGEADRGGKGGPRPGNPPPGDRPPPCD